MTLKNRQPGAPAKTKTYIALPPDWSAPKADAEKLLYKVAKLTEERKKTGRARRPMERVVVTYNEGGDLVLLREQAVQNREGMLKAAEARRKRSAESAPVKSPAPDPLAAALAEARQRGTETVATILAGDDMLNSRDFAKLLGLSVPAVHDKMKRREVLGLEGAKRGVKFPRWQVGSNGRLPAELPLLFEQLGDEPWSVYRFLVQRHPELDGARGHEALRAGRGAALLALVDNVATGTFS